MKKRPDKLIIDPCDAPEESFVANGDVFIKDNVAINSSGIAMRNNPKTFVLAYEDLEIGEIIGRGCSSVVLQSVHTPTRTPLALKIINLFDKSKRNQLIREITTLYDAQCPNLISFYGAFYREGTISIALEYMDGGSLANVLDQVGPIPEPIIAGVAFQILWGLAYMKHEKKVHRDIKPSNLLINSSGEVKVTDFGVSAELQSSLAMCGTFVGTFKYMSPERILNRPYSYMSDIWSFGLAMMEMATGVYPFEKEWKGGGGGGGRIEEEKEGEEEEDGRRGEGKMEGSGETRSRQREGTGTGVGSGRPSSSSSALKSTPRALLRERAGRAGTGPNTIEMAQIIIDADIPELGPGFSPLFRDFLKQCLRRDPSSRLPAEVLLCSPFLQSHGATSPLQAREIVHRWIQSVTGQSESGEMEVEMETIRK